MSTGKIIGLIVGVCLIVGLLFIGACGAIIFKGYKSSDTDVGPLVDEFFNGVERGDLGPTFQEIATEAEKAKIDPAQVSSYGETLALRLGKLESKSLTNFHMSINNGVSMRKLTYNATFEKAEGTINVEAEKEGGEWRIRFINVKSPALVPTYATCSSCGKSHPKDAQFCPACGAATAAPSTPKPVPK